MCFLYSYKWNFSLLPEVWHNVWRLLVTVNTILYCPSPWFFIPPMLSLLMSWLQFCYLCRGYTGKKCMSRECYGFMDDTTALLLMPKLAEFFLYIVLLYLAKVHKNDLSPKAYSLIRWILSKSSLESSVEGFFNCHTFWGTVLAAFFVPYCQ